MFVIKKTMEVLTYAELRIANKSVSFPGMGPEDWWLEDHGYAEIKEVTPENLDTKEAVLNGVELVDGEYRQKWDQREIPYHVLRKERYPSIGDQLDAIWKQLNYDRLEGRALIQDADDMLGAILAVKAKYPKEEE